jgi:hypothetical protein
MEPLPFIIVGAWLLVVIIHAITYKHRPGYLYRSFRAHKGLFDFDEISVFETAFLIPEDAIVYPPKWETHHGTIHKGAKYVLQSTQADTENRNSMATMWEWGNAETESSYDGTKLDYFNFDELAMWVEPPMSVFKPFPVDPECPKYRRNLPTFRIGPEAMRQWKEALRELCKGQPWPKDRRCPDSRTVTFTITADNHMRSDFVHEISNIKITPVQ